MKAKLGVVGGVARVGLKRALIELGSLFAVTEQVVDAGLFDEDIIVVAIKDESAIKVVKVRFMASPLEIAGSRFHSQVRDLHSWSGSGSPPPNNRSGCGRHQCASCKGDQAET